MSPYFYSLHCILADYARPDYWNDWFYFRRAWQALADEENS